MAKVNLIEAIDNLLPQTQCGLCGFNGCLPYAEAIATKGEEITRCPPGGVTTLLALANLMGKDPSPYIQEMEAKAKASSIAVIREEECIGCTKCIQVCPVDAILGSSKRMHTVIADECTGCELCIEPCPVDCIDMIQTDLLQERLPSSKSALARTRFKARQQRLNKIESKNSTLIDSSKFDSHDSRKAEIQAAVSRVQAKRLKSES